MHPSNSYTKELEVCENSNNDIGPTFVHISLLPLLFNVPHCLLSTLCGTYSFVSHIWSVSLHGCLLLSV